MPSNNSDCRAVDIFLGNRRTSRAKDRKAIRLRARVVSPAHGGYKIGDSSPTVTHILRFRFARKGYIYCIRMSYYRASFIYVQLAAMQTKYHVSMNTTIFFLITKTNNLVCLETCKRINKNYYVLS